MFDLRLSGLRVDDFDGEFGIHRGAVMLFEQLRACSRMCLAKGVRRSSSSKVMTICSDIDHAGADGCQVIAFIHLGDITQGG